MSLIDDAIPNSLWRAWLYEEAPIPIALVDSDGWYLSCNDRYCELLGYAPSELRTKRWQDLTHREDIPGDAANVTKLLSEAAAGNYELFKRYIRKDNSDVWVVIHAQKVLGLDRQFVCLLVHAIPLTTTGSVSVTPGPGRGVEVRPSLKWRDIVRDNPVQAAAAVVGILLLLGRDNSLAFLMALLHAWSG